MVRYSIENIVPLTPDSFLSVLDKSPNSKFINSAHYSSFYHHKILFDKPEFLYAAKCKD